MSCITSKFTLVTVAIGTSVSYVSGNLSSNFGIRDDVVKATFTVDKKALLSEISADSIRLDLSAVQICTIHKSEKFIKVDKDVIWVTPDIWEQIQVMSNTDWEIV